MNPNLTNEHTFLLEWPLNHKLKTDETEGSCGGATLSGRV